MHASMRTCMIKFGFGLPGAAEAKFLKTKMAGRPAGWPDLACPPNIGGHPPYIGSICIYSGEYFVQNMSPNSRDVLFLKKKGPCQATAGCRRNWFSPKIPKSKNSDKHNTIFRKGTRGKMTPQVFSIQWQSPFLISSPN